MPEYALWSLIIALIMLAFGLALQIAQLASELKTVRKELTLTTTKLNTFQKPSDNDHPGVSKLLTTTIDKKPPLPPDPSHTPPPATSDEKTTIKQIDIKPWQYG